MEQAKQYSGEIKAAIWLGNQNRTEGQRYLFHNTRFMEKKMKGGSTTQVNVTYEDGTTI